MINREDEHVRIMNQEAPAKTRYSDKTSKAKSRVQDQEDTVRLIEDIPHPPPQPGEDPA